MRVEHTVKALGLVVLLAAVPAHSPAAERSLLLQSTTSTAHSGLYDHLLPMFTARTGIAVHVVAVGTGQAINNARNGDGDVLLVHDTPAEEAFVSQGFGVARHDLMYNDFVIVGPARDPAGIRGMGDAASALVRVARSGAHFASRGDDSGTHRKERMLWRAAGVDASAHSGAWYRELGSGMGATLNAAAGMAAYTLTDRGTWLGFHNRGALRLMVEGDPALFNQYGIILVNPDRHPRVNAAEGRTFIRWVLGPEGQAAIAGYRIDGQQLFFPNATEPRAGAARARSARRPKLKRR